MTPNNLERAVIYAGLGWSVFPTMPAGLEYIERSSKKTKISNGKNPHTENGFKAATTDIAQIEDWYTDHPSRGIGLWPGPAKLLVLDVDIKDGKGGELQLSVLEDCYRQVLPATLTQRTPSGGRHLFFRIPPGLQLSNAKIPGCPDIDIRCHSGYVCLEGTQTSEGGYAFDDWAPLSDDPPEIAEAPDWLIGELAKVNQTNPEPQTPRFDNVACLPDANAIGRDLPQRLRELIEYGVEVGDRSDQFFHAVAWCQKEGLSRAETVALILAHPNGIAKKYTGREAQEVDRCWGKLDTVADPNAPWRELVPLVNAEAPQPYPVDCLPDLVCDAVTEVQSFVQAPMAMVAVSALSAISLACQGYTDVERDAALRGPCSLFTLVLGDSGERKTTVDRYFTTALREWESEQRRAVEPEVKRCQASLDSWGAKREGLLAKIRENAKAKGSVDDSRNLQAELEAHSLERPELPKVPRLFYSDITIEQLGYALAMNWPVAGVFVNEAAEFFGGHSMKGDNLMHALGFFNKAWDAQVLRSDRKTTESWETHGARVTVSLSVQEAVLREFAEKGGDKVRGSGFWARYLVAVPASTQGERPYKEPPLHWPKLNVFHEAVRRVMSRSLALDDKGQIRPDVLQLTPEAKALWVEYFNLVEVQLRTGGHYQDVRDVAGKSADQAARLAALIHWFVHGPEAGLLIKGETMTCACALAAWHLDEARRFFGELAMPQHIADAVRVERWLIDWTQRKNEPPTKRDLQQCGPNDLRKAKDRRERALRLLLDEHHIRNVQNGRKAWIQLHPKLEARP